MREPFPLLCREDNNNSKGSNRDTPNSSSPISLEANTTHKAEAVMLAAMVETGHLVPVAITMETRVTSLRSPLDHTTPLLAPFN